ncbi:MAG TPA: response regulator transcription factor [Mycobacteriales bacterium]|nr:response regulator transcription factor [Mycobacteriales bacterium]
MKDRRVVRAIRVLIVDDHRTFAEMLALALGAEADFECVGTAGGSLAAVELAGRLRPDMIVMDIQLGPDSGLNAARTIRATLPDSILVVVSAHDGPEWVVRAARAGANAFVPKTGSLPQMLSTLRRARPGSTLVAPSLFGLLPRTAPDAADAPEKLTARELEVLGLMGQGMAPDAIAHLLNISVNTCRSYVKTIHARLGVRSQLEAVVEAHRLGLIEVASGR